jgi:4-hydroxy-tetrahydrodipicolinate reductase
VTARVLVAGPFGQTGSAVVDAAGRSSLVTLAGGLVSSDRQEQRSEAKLQLFTTLDMAAQVDVLIDFTQASATADFAEQCAARGVALVTGTTGLEPAAQARVENAATQVPVVQSGNFSLGVNLLLDLVARAATALPDFDAEIIEAHHRRKVDAPSGTALMLGEAVAQARDTSLQAKGRHSREGRIGPRANGEIGFAVVRGGGIRGDHEILFAGEGEVLSLAHRAIDRQVFAEGALQAAHWTKGRQPGLYSMRDVLGLS